MRYIIAVFIITVLIVRTGFFVSSTYAAAGINQTINFQGKLVDNNGLNVTNGNYDIIFYLYAASSGGSALWTETWNSGTSQVAVQDGVFRVALGTHSTFSSFNFNDDSLYLAIKVGADAEMTPRIRFTSVPYAFVAKTVVDDALDFDQLQDTLDLDANLTVNQTGFTWTQTYTGTSAPGLSYTASGAVSSGNAAALDVNVSNGSTTVPAMMLTNAGSGFALRINDDGTTTDSTPLVVDADGNVGIGTTSPLGKLTISNSQASSLIPSIQFVPTGAAGIATVVYYAGGSNQAGELSAIGDYGSSAAPYHLYYSASNGANPALVDAWQTSKLSVTQTTADIYFDRGNVGIGTTAPVSLFSVGTGSPFQVDTNGDIIKLKNLTYAWPSAHITNGFLQNNGSGTLTWTTITGAGGVTGTGTDNYIPRWNGTTALENSIIFDTGTNVGIGTTAPSVPLEVRGDIKFGGVGSNKVGTLTSNTTQVTLRAPAGAHLGLGANGGNSDIFINSSGNVGIGTTAPTAALHVVGNITSPGTDANSEKFGYGASADNYGTALGRSSVATGTSGTIAIGYTASATGQQSTAIGYSASASGIRGLAFGYDVTNTGNDSMVIGNSASVGHNSIVIGQSASTANSYAVLLGRSTSVTGDAGIAIGEAAAAGANQFVSGSSSYPINNVFFGKGISNASPTSYVINGTGGSGTDIVGADLILAAGKATGNAVGGGLLFQTSDAGASSGTPQSLSTKMAILASGNVGIGTTAPSQALHVVGSGLYSGTLALNGAALDSNTGVNISLGTTTSAVKGLNVTSSSTGDMYGLYNTLTNTGTSKTTSGVYSIINQQTTSDWYEGIAAYNWVSTGNDAYIQGAYGAKTHLTTHANDYGMGYSVISNSLSTGGDQYGLYIDLNDPDTTNYGIYEMGGATNYFSGNVGIGTTAPSQALHVVGSARITGALYDSSNSAGSSTNILTSTGTGTAWTTVSSALDTTYFKQNGNSFTALATLGTNDAYGLAFETGGTEWMRILTDGKVGIGTTSPGDKLDVVGEIDTSTYYKLGNIAILKQVNTASLLLGHYAGNSLPAGADYNTLLGYNAGYSMNNATADYNIAIGYNSGYGNTSGAYNLYAGTESGYYNQTGMYNIFQGYQAGRGTANYTGSDNNVAFGNGALNSIGSNTDGNIALGLSAGFFNQTGMYNIFQGVSAGQGTGYYTGSSNNIAFGATALYSIGSNAYNNIALGYEAGYSNTTGTNNYYSGNQAGYNNQTGTYNIFQGANAGAGTAAYTGSDNNIAIGPSTLYSIASNADNNIALGYEAGYSTTTGDGNIFLGYQAGYSETGSNKLYIDNSNTSSPLIWGDFSTNVVNFSGNVGIGTTAPSQALHVVGSARITGALYDSSNSAGSSTNILTSTGTGTAWTSVSSAFDTTYFKQNGNSFTALATLGTNDNYGLAFETNNTERIRIDTSGNVGIGTTSPTAKLSVAGATSTISNTTGNLTITPAGNLIISSGNVGIGTTAPSSLLEVAGDAEIANYLYFGNSTSEYLRWDSSNFLLSDDLLPNANDSLNLGSDTARWADLFLGGETLHLGASTTDEGTISYTSGNVLSFSTDSTTNGDIAFFTDDLYLDKSTGNVGIGTTSPTTDLQIGAGSSSHTQIDPGTLDIRYSTDSRVFLTSNIHALLGTGNGAGGIRFQTLTGGNAYIGGAAAGNDLMLNPTAGNVGIGTTAPSQKLDVLGGNATIRINATSGEPGIALDRAGTTTGFIQAFSTGMGFAGGWTNPQMFLTSGGNVGIGTTAPAGLLHVYGNDAYFGNNTATDGNYVKVRGDGTFSEVGLSSQAYTQISLYGNPQVTNQTSHGGLTLFAQSSGITSGWYPLTFAAGGNIRFIDTASSNATRMLIQTGTGNVGIGTTTPGHKLEVAGSVLLNPNGGGGQYLYLYDTTNSVYGANGWLDLQSTSTLSMATGAYASIATTGNNALYNINFKTQNTERMRIDNSGNVGIGTTSPGEKLEVRDGRILINHNDNGSALLDANVASLDIVNRSGTAGAGPKINFHGWGYGTYSNQIGAAIAAPLISASVSGATQDLVFLTRNADADAELSERMRILKGGNVGIGTTSPAVKLSVYNTADSAISGVTTVTAKVGVYGSSTTAAGYGVMGYNNNAAGVGILAQQDSTGYALYSQGGKNYFSGSVGIGTTAPAGRFDLTDTSNTAASLSLTNNTATTIGNAGNTLGVLDLQSTTLTTGNFLNMEVNALTTGTALNISRSGAGLTTGGELVNLDMGAAVAGNGLNIATTGVYTGTGLLTLTANSATTGTLAAIAGNGLTTGTGLSIASTSTALTTGRLMSLDWSPSGSTEIYATGDLFRINTGTYGNVGNLLNVLDDGSSLFSVSQTQITNNLPTAFNAAGDVSMAYDLIFTNQTTANIFSNGPLSIVAGESWENNNLNLQTYGTGDLIANLSGTGRLLVPTGNVGIGTTAPGYTLDVKSSGTNVARFIGSNSTGCTLSDGGIIACSSDQNLKKNIVASELGLDAIMNLRTVTFNWNSQAEGDKKYLGFIAQEVEQIAPDLVTTDSTGYKQLNSIGIIPIVAKAIQEQQGIITTLQAEVHNSVPDAKIATVSSKLETLNSKVSGWDGLFISIQSIIQTIQETFVAIQSQLGFVRSDIQSTKEQVASLSASLTDIANWKEAVSSGGAVLGQSSGSAVLGATDSAMLGEVATASSLMVRNNLQVDGRTTLFDLTVLNKLTSGVIQIGAGIDGDEINASTGIRFQTLAQGPVDFMNGKVIIDVDGSISAKHFKLDTLDATSSTGGKAIMPAGEILTTVETTSVNANSMVYITIQGDYAPATRYWVTNQVEGDSFMVQFDRPTTLPVEFSWFIIN